MRRKYTQMREDAVEYPLDSYNKLSKAQQRIFTFLMKYRGANNQQRIQNVEIAEEEAITTTLAKNKWELTKRRINQDLVTCGIAATKTSFNKSSGIEIDYVDPARIIFSYTEDPNFEDIYYVGEIKNLTIPEIAKQFPELTEDELTKIQQTRGYQRENLYSLIERGQDAIDGILARYLKCESVLGGYLDAIADKIMVNTSFYMLCNMGILPDYIFYITILRDMLIIAGTIFKDINQPQTVNPIFLSKINTFMQFTLVIFCTLFLANIAHLNYMQDIINTVLLTTIFSAVEYIYNYRRNLPYKNIKFTSQI